LRGNRRQARARAKRRREIGKMGEEEIEAEIRKTEAIMAERSGPVASTTGKPRANMGRLPWILKLLGMISGQCG
jgi:hypothetical protein